MPKQWTLYAHPEFLRALRQIPRGLAGLVSDEISILERNALPAGYEVVSAAENRYRLNVYGFVVTYEVREDAHAIHLLWIEPERF